MDHEREKPVVMDRQTKSNLKNLTGTIGTRFRKAIWWGVCLTMVVFVGFWACLPRPLFNAPYSTVLLDRDGRLLGAAIADDQQWRFPPVKTLPLKIEKAIVSYEDRRFFDHPGVDPLAVGRAMLSNIRSGRVVSGASTVTMQVIRLSRPGRPRSIVQKLVQMVMAMRLELALDKTDILALYAAHAPFGGNVVGVEAASWRYFGRSPEQLSWAESAMLAVLPNSPALIHPGRNRNLLLEKRNNLLDILRQRHEIDDLTYRLAKTEPLPPRPVPIPRHSPHLLSRLKQSIGGNPSERFSIQLQQNPHQKRIQTTLKRDVQLRTVATIQRHQERLAANGIFNAAALIIDISSGNVVAYVGNVHDFGDREHGRQVDVITAPRSTGSILKPILYAAMMESGELLPQTLVADIPTRMGGFAPQNYNRTYLGAVPASRALARSLNIPAVRMLRMYGVDRFSDILKQLGMTTLVRPAKEYGLSLILGGAEGSLWDITGIYAGMARQILWSHQPAPRRDKPFSTPRILAEKTSGNKGIGEIPQTGSSQTILGAAACWLTLEAMLEVGRPGLEGSWKEFVSSRKIAWKTGTSYGHRDGWAVGVTPQYAVGVWAGNADGEGRPGLTGLSTAAPILFDLMGMFENTPWFLRPPDGLTSIEVCASSGYRAGMNCGNTRTCQVTRNGLQTPPCAYCRIVHLDTTSNWRVHSTCERVAQIKPVKRFVLPAAMEWYYRQNHLDYQPLPPYRKDCLDEIQGLSPQLLSLIYPAANGRIHVPIELDGRKGQTVFEATHRNSGATIHWHLDDHYIGSTRDIHQLAMAPAAGEHIVTLIDEDGVRLQRFFTVSGEKP